MSTDEWQTVFPLLARHYGEHLRRENQSRLDRGEAPLPLEDTVAQAMELKAQDLAQKTHWPNIDLIGAQLDLVLGRVSGAGLAHGRALVEALGRPLRASRG